MYPSLSAFQAALTRKYASPFRCPPPAGRPPLSYYRTPVRPAPWPALVRNDVINCLFERDRADHVAASLVRRHGFKQPGFAVEHADARGAEHLVAGKRVEVAIEVPDIDFEMRRRLSAVDEHRNVHTVR